MIVICSLLTVLLAAVDISAVKDFTSTTVAPVGPVSARIAHTHVGKHKRQIFREQVNPFIGGRIPETAYHSDRLLLNRLNAAGFSLPDGVLLAHKRPPIGQSATDDQSSVLLRFLQTTDNRPTPPEGVTHRPEPIESTYLLRVPAGWKNNKVQGLPPGRPLPSVISFPGVEQLAKLLEDHRTPSSSPSSSLGPSPSSALQPPPPPQHYHPPPHPPHPPPPLPPPPPPPNHQHIHARPQIPPPNHHPPPPHPHHPHPPPPNHPVVHYHPHNHHIPHPQPSNHFPVHRGESAESLLNAHLPSSVFDEAHSGEDFDSSLLLNEDDFGRSGPWSSFFSEEQADFLLPDRLSIRSRPQHSAYQYSRHQNNHLPGLTHYGPAPF